MTSPHARLVLSRDMRRLEVLDEDGNRILAGPAGSAHVDLPNGVTLYVDYLEPARLLRIVLEPASDEREQAELLASLAGASAAEALVNASESIAVSIEPGPSLGPASRLALLLTSLERSWRPVRSLWAAEAAGLARAVHPSLGSWTERLAAAARSSLLLLPIDRHDLLNATVDAAAALAHGVDPDGSDPELAALRDSLEQLRHTASESKPMADGPVLPVHLEERRPQASRARGKATLVHGDGRSGPAPAARVDLNDLRPGLLAETPFVQVDGDDVQVQVALTEAAAAAPPLFLDRLRAVARDGEGRLVERSGFGFGDVSGVATARFRSWADLPRDVWFDLTSGPRSAVAQEDLRLVERAVAAGRTAADLERMAAAVSSQARPLVIQRASAAWFLAARRWSDARRASLEAAAATRGKTLESIEIPTPFEVERLSPALRYWLGELDLDAMGTDGLLAAEELAEAIGDPKRRVELALAALERDHSVVDELDLEEVLWSAIASGDRALVVRAATLWSTSAEDAEEDMLGPEFDDEP